MSDPAEPRLDRTPAGVKLCALSELSDPGARNFVLQIGGRRFHGFVVRHGDRVTGFVDRCPHMGLPLAKTLDDYLAPDGHVVCAWHGAVFDPVDGACLGGPCVGASLSAWPVDVVDGRIVTA
jgi:nitrite reductase/ring-hydroxylating ferredoxin subunit